MAKKKTTKKKAAKKATSKASTLQDFCRGLPGTTEDIKWGHDLVFSVGNKMYAAFDLDHGYDFGFKSEEEEFLGLIQVPGIIPAPYMAKHFWVAVRDRTALPAKEWKRLLAKAHALVFANLSQKKQREILGA
jgi:predicted DNA-binding protein (MmcQ/YjbR family)